MTAYRAPATGRLALYVTKMPGQFLAEGCTVFVEIDGVRHPRTWGNHLFELAPGNHQVNVWFEYMLTKFANRASAWIPIHAGYDTFAKYETAMFVFSAGKLAVLGQQPFPTGYG